MISWLLQNMVGCSFMYRLNTEVKVFMGFIIPSDAVARLINAIETVPRCLTGFYHDTLPSNVCVS